jgi:CHU_C Type IX secretion signal domain
MENSYKNSSIRIGLLSFLLLFGSLKAICQQNLIRNHSFESGPSNRPNHISQLEKANHWRHYQQTTSDWFKHNGPDYVRGRRGCNFMGESNLINATDSNLIPLHDGIAYAGTIKWNDGIIGEGLQQKLSQKLDRGIYEISFWYLIPCASRDYQFSIHLSNTLNDTDHLVCRLPLDTIDTGVWKQFTRQFFVAEPNYYDWFLLLFEGSAATNSDFQSYLYYDDFELKKLGCTSCSPSGTISWNPAVPDHFMPNYDGVRTYPMDYWCISNINNAIGANFTVFDRYGGTVYHQSYYDPNGLYDLDACWNGRTTSGDVVSAGLSPFWGIVEMYNCDESLVYDTRNTLAQGVTLFGFNAGTDGIYLNQFTIQPEEWGQLSLPFAAQYQHLYGGNWAGQHTWRACEEIFTGGNTQTHVQYFRAGSLSEIDLIAGQVIVLGSGTYFNLGSDVSLRIDSTLQCCPGFRLGVPCLPEQIVEVDSMGSFTLAQLPNMEQEIGASKVTAFPNPFEESLAFQFAGFPSCLVQLEIVDVSGRVVINQQLNTDEESILSTDFLPAGVYCWRIVTANGLFSGKVVKVE